MRRKVGLVSIWLVLASLTVAIAPGLSVFAVVTGNEGCTPGYWKNHTNNWEEASPEQTVGDTFFTATGSYPQQGDTLLQALNYGGGPGIDGARRILLRAAVAAYLNAAHDGLGYPLRRHGGDGFVDDVTTLLVNGDRASILAFADFLDRLNNLGCPLGNGNGNGGGGIDL